MNIVECSSKDTWKKAEHSSFLQSWEWGEFQKSVGYNPIRIQCTSTYIQGFIHRLPFGQSYVYIPHCPAISTEMMEELLHWAKKAGVMFLRIESKEKMMFPESVQIFPTKNRQHQCTLFLDVHKTEEELFADMHSKTRYNIRLAKRKNLHVNFEKNVDVFWELYSETTKRDNFRGFNKNYYAHMLSLGMIQQITVYHDTMPLASGIFVNYQGTYTYVHGASTDKKRECMAPYLLQWSAIVNAKAYTCHTYDFWGIAPPALDLAEDKKTFHTYTWQANHILSGVTRFKAGFGGSVVEYPQAVEMVARPRWYHLYQMVQKVRRK